MELIILLIIIACIISIYRMLNGTKNKNKHWNITEGARQMKELKNKQS